MPTSRSGWPTPGWPARPSYADRYRAWCDYFDRLRIEAVGLGWLVLRKAGRSSPWIRIEDWPHPLEQPLGPTVAAELDAVNRLAAVGDAELLRTRWRLAEDAVEEITGHPGQADPQHIVLRQQRGFRRALAVDTATAGILGACDGELTLADIVASVAHLTGDNPARLTADTLARLPSLVVDGWLH